MLAHQRELSTIDRPTVDRRILSLSRGLWRKFLMAAAVGKAEKPAGWLEQLRPRRLGGAAGRLHGSEECDGQLEL
jgi:hypothetical protein